ncbi:MAG: adenylate/guanylate cyclase domain-containing protein [Spirochaetaceae bacterium]|jgi:class 3 adenylate cyclase|nr:adenylate/guanylate cyclase domain-containing protein [Spirochaetaceae bacterium]
MNVQTALRIKKSRRTPCQKKFPLALKFCLIVLGLAVFQTGLLIGAMLVFSAHEAAAKAEKTAALFNKQKTDFTNENLDALRRASLLFISQMESLRENGNARSRHAAESLFFNLHPSIAALIVTGTDETGIFVHPGFAAETGHGGITAQLLAEFLREKKESFRQASTGMMFTGEAGFCALTAFFIPLKNTPLDNGSPGQAAAILFPDQTFSMPDGAAAARTAIASAAFQNGIAALALLMLMLPLTALCAGTLTRPLTALIHAARAVGEGCYSTPLKNCGGEAGVLTARFMTMRGAIENFEKWTDSIIVQCARNGELPKAAEPHLARKTVLLFVSIRNFELFTAAMNDREIVSCINSFLSYIAPCITRTGGRIQKYLGSSGFSLFAHWGAQESAGSIERDTLCAIRSVLMIRSEVRRWNSRRFALKNKPARNAVPFHEFVKIACALHTGEVITGNLGSAEKMEWAVLGGAVKTAAGFVEANVRFDTDILLSEPVLKNTGGLLIAEEMQPVPARVKGGSLRVFALVNFRGNTGAETMNEVRALWNL